MSSPRPAPTATWAPTTSPDVSTTPTPANADSSTNSKPSDTKSPSNPTPPSGSPIPITNQPDSAAGSPTPTSQTCLVTIVTSQAGFDGARAAWCAVRQQQAGHGWRGG